MTKAVNFSRDLADMIRFARWCAAYNVAPADAARLVHFARKAFKAGERECNTGQSADRQRDQFEECAKELGFSVQWPGLWPTIARGGRDQIHLPLFG